MATKLARITEDMKRRGASDLLLIEKRVCQEDTETPKVKKLVLKEKDRMIEMLRIQLVEAQKKINQLEEEKSQQKLTHFTVEPKSTAVNEMELLSLQHEIRDKNTHIEILQQKYNQLESNFKEILGNHRQLLGHLENQKQQIKKVR